MDEFTLKSKLFFRDPWDELQNKDKKKEFGRRASRRSSKQHSSTWYQEYMDMITPLDHWDSVCDKIWDGDYNYFDDQDIYEEYWEWYQEQRGE